MKNTISREELYNALSTNKPDFKGKKLFVWGMGNTALMYQGALKRLESEQFFVAGYCDNDLEKLKGTRIFCGKPVLTIEELKAEKDIYVLICTPQPKVICAISEQLDNLQIPNINIDSAIFKLHVEELMKCYDALIDEESRNIYAQLVLCRMAGAYPDDLPVDRTPYFTLNRFWNCKIDEVFVDCGAFVGDVMEHYIWNKGGMFGKIIAFEPDKDNYHALYERVNRLKREWHLGDEHIKLLFGGVGETDKDEYFIQDKVGGGQCSRFSETLLRGGVQATYLRSTQL